MPNLKERRQAFWKSPDSYTTSLTSLLVDVYGFDALYWTPETIRMEIMDDFSVQLPPGNLDKIMAGIALLTTDDFFTSLPDFIMLCNVLSGDLYDPVQWDPADAGEIAWGISEALILAPPENSQFSLDIRAYIGAVLDAEGIINPPDVLRIAVGRKSTFVPEDFSDDPVMYETIWRVENGKSRAITDMLRDRILDLASQLESLPLENGDASQYAERLTNAVKQWAAPEE